MRQLSVWRKPRMQETPDIRLLEGVVAQEIIDAMRAASASLRAHGIRHALVGALAVGAHGWPRATRDVDFLLGPEGFEQHSGGIVTFAPGVPLRVGQVPIDPLLPGPDEEHLAAGVDAAPESGGIPVVPIEALVYMKLRSPRRKDAADIVELVAVGIDVRTVFDYLQEHAPELVGSFDELIREAEQE